jgi:PKHD-type hydroxylase
MIIQLGQVLDSTLLGAIVSLIDGLEFVDGRASAGWHARGVKANSQAASSPVLEAIQRQVLEALKQHEVFQALALPARIGAPLVSRYTVGESYGLHVDDALMGQNLPLRTDFSITIFLNDPGSYDGGELEVSTLAGVESAKFSAGDAALYASTALHRVAPVTRGRRLAAVTWAESLIRHAEQREMLFDLDRARRMLFESGGKTEAFDLVSKTHANLMRRWVSR